MHVQVRDRPHEPVRKRTSQQTLERAARFVRQHRVVDVFSLNQRSQRTLGAVRNVQRHDPRVQILCQVERPDELCVPHGIEIAAEVNDQQVRLQSLREAPAAADARPRSR